MVSQSTSTPQTFLPFSTLSGPFPPTAISASEDGPGLRFARLLRDLDQSVAALASWTLERSPLLRSFAVEALRPRGVWCNAIAELRTAPERGLPLLQPMRAESEK